MSPYPSLLPQHHHLRPLHTQMRNHLSYLIWLLLMRMIREKKRCSTCHKPLHSPSGKQLAENPSQIVCHQ